MWPHPQGMQANKVVLLKTLALLQPTHPRLALAPPEESRTHLPCQSIRGLQFILALISGEGHSILAPIRHRCTGFLPASRRQPDKQSEECLRPILENISISRP